MISSVAGSAWSAENWKFDISSVLKASRSSDFLSLVKDCSSDD